MRSFKTFLPEDLDNLQYSESTEKAFVLGLLADIDDKISTVDTEIAEDLRSGKTNSSKLGISQLMLDKDREKYAGLAVKRAFSKV